MSKIIFLKEEVYQVIGCAFAVYNHLGPGFVESVYQEAMAIELEDRGILFEAQKRLDVFYKDRKLTKRFVPDVVTHGCLIVELKSVDRLTRKDYVQILNYLKATRNKVGVLVNFGSLNDLEWKRFAL